MAPDVEESQPQELPLINDITLPTGQLTPFPFPEDLDLLHLTPMDLESDDLPDGLGHLDFTIDVPGMNPDHTGEVDEVHSQGREDKDGNCEEGNNYRIIKKKKYYMSFCLFTKCTFFCF